MEAFAAADISYDAEAQGRHVLRAQDRHLHRRRPRARMADGDDPGRPDDAARAVRPDLHRRGRSAAAPDRHPSRHLRLARAVHRHPRRAFRRRLPALARAGPGGRHPDRRSARRGGRGARRRSCGARPARRGRRSDNRMQNKIRLAQEQKVPYMLVLGDREVEARTDAPRARNAARGEQQEAVAWDDLADAPGRGGERPNRPERRAPSSARRGRASRSAGGAARRWAYRGARTRGQRRRCRTSLPRSLCRRCATRGDGRGPMVDRRIERRERIRAGPEQLFALATTGRTASIGA